jgi:hypothetical protein
MRPAKTVTMQVESIHDITSFMCRGDRIEIIVAEYMVLLQPHTCAVLAADTAMI